MKKTLAFIILSALILLTACDNSKPQDEPDIPESTEYIQNN